MVVGSAQIGAQARKQTRAVGQSSFTDPIPLVNQYSQTPYSLVKQSPKQRDQVMGQDEDGGIFSTTE